MFKKRPWLAFALVLGAVTALPLTTACHQEEESAGEKLEESIEEVGDEVEDAADEIEDAADG